MTERIAADQPVRDAAIDPRQSFIVQAPAGSGKTELLMQRYLALLATVKDPEEIIAITFTRKATAEMRDRILSALEQAENDAAPDQAHAKKTWMLARVVLEQDRKQGWNLQENPNRLRIQTIDALCASLTRLMPVLSGTGINPRITDQAEDLYRQAARATLRELPSVDAIGLLLSHLDNHWQKLEDMITRLLERRDHWLRHLPTQDSDLEKERKVLEEGLQGIIENQLEKVAIPQALQQEWVKLADYAARNLLQESKNTSLTTCAGLKVWPDPLSENLPLWEGLVELVLTKEDCWRVTINKGMGFPTSKDKRKAFMKAMKERWSCLITQLQALPGLLEDLQAIRKLPSAHYRDDQWAVLRALFLVLKRAVAHLKIVFRDQGMVDHTEVSLAAIEALGSTDEPTDLALMLDYRISHLLVDEFQDTSVSQYTLLRQLTAGWTSGDGRTLFLVGDPMQSIYRFREADVSLFLEVQERKALGAVPLTPLTLEVNFRSDAAIVDWVNGTFHQAMPERSSVTHGAVSYTASQAFHAGEHNAGVEVCPLIDADRREEARQVCDRAEEALGHADRTAILVRNRSHLVEILNELRERGLPYQAVEIEKLAEQPVIRDLCALTHALSHLADRTAWLSVLRAPWCGLELEDLERLAENPSMTIWSQLIHTERLTRLSEEGQQRLARLIPVFSEALAQRQRIPLSRWVEGVWLQLGGPACLQKENEREDARVFFEMLQTLDEGYSLSAQEELECMIEGLFAAPASGQPLLQVMTIHKAKGLEFDTVILPALDRTSRSDDRQLLQWTEWQNPKESRSELLLAPIEEAGRDRERINTFLSSLETERVRHEAVRLLYVAATRARRRLHLLASPRRDRRGELRVPSRSLLACIWPAVEAVFMEAAKKAETPVDEAKSPVRFVPFIKRLPRDWQLPSPPPAIPWQPKGMDLNIPEEEDEPLEFIWAGTPARHIGTVVHRILQQIAEEGLDCWDEDHLKTLLPGIESWLLESGLAKPLLSMAVNQVYEAVENTLSDERGRWILKKHQQARSEYPLTGILEGEPTSVILDRTFIDENGTRWIIDYKTGRHEGGGLEEFLDREQERYRKQLESYARLMAKREDRPMRLALYFPLLAAWREWVPEI